MKYYAMIASPMVAQEEPQKKQPKSGTSELFERKHIMQYIIKTSLRGLIRTAWGSLTAALIYVALYRFATIPSVGGYIAIGEFIMAVASLVVGCWNVYHQGIGSFKKVR